MLKYSCEPIVFLASVFSILVFIFNVFLSTIHHRHTTYQHHLHLRLYFLHPRKDAGQSFAPGGLLKPSSPVAPARGGPADCHPTANMSRIAPSSRCLLQFVVLPHAARLSRSCYWLWQRGIASTTPCPAVHLSNPYCVHVSG